MDFRALIITKGVVSENSVVKFSKIFFLFYIGNRDENGVPPRHKSTMVRSVYKEEWRGAGRGGLEQKKGFQKSSARKNPPGNAVTRRVTLYYRASGVPIFTGRRGHGPGLVKRARKTS